MSVNRFGHAAEVELFIFYVDSVESIYRWCAWSNSDAAFYGPSVFWQYVDNDVLPWLRREYGESEGAEVEYPTNLGERIGIEEVMDFRDAGSRINFVDNQVISIKGPVLSRDHCRVVS